jgi:DNA-binding transcriptional MerR regulator
MNGRLSITDVAERLGVTTKTITRWEKAGKIKRAKRDWRGWRVYEPEEVDLMKSFVETVY